MYGIIDCDNCYVSCERVFRPNLEGKPVIVLSNNDGCVVARSNEAKQLGITAGMPYFKVQQQYLRHTRLCAAVDRINRLHGTDALVLATQQYTAPAAAGAAGASAKPTIQPTAFADVIKHDFRSKNPTTRWSDIISLY